MIWYRVVFTFDNDESKTLSHYVQASDIIDAENKAFEKLGENGKAHKTGASITPIVLNVTLGRPDKKYDSFKDQMADDPKIIELAAMYLRGDQNIKDDITKALNAMFEPLGQEYQKQAIQTLKMVVGLCACHDVQKYGKTKYLEDWLKEMRS